MTADKIGIIAGHGDLASRVIASCQSAGTNYHVLAYENQADPDIVANHPHTWLQLAKAGQAIKTMKDLGISKVVMTGYFVRPQWSDLKPDLKGMKLLSKIAGKTFGDDGLLRVIIDFFESEGIRVISTEDILGTSHLCPEGILTTAKPSEQAYNDINHGFSIAKAIGKLDIGQGVVVQSGVVLGVEALEGTDKLIQRCAELTSKSGAGEQPSDARPIYVKVIKPGQDTRVDRSVIGPNTIRIAAQSGYAGIALEANEIIVVDHDECVDIANQHGLFIIGMTTNV